MATLNMNLFAFWQFFVPSVTLAQIVEMPEGLFLTLLEMRSRLEMCHGAEFFEC